MARSSCLGFSGVTGVAGLGVTGLGLTGFSLAASIAANVLVFSSPYFSNQDVCSCSISKSSTLRSENIFIP